MSITVTVVKNYRKQRAQDRRSIQSLLAPFETLAANSTHLSSNCGATFRHCDDLYELPRYVFIGPRGGSELLRIGIFATIHGDQPEGAHALVEFAQILEKSPDLARGYCLLLYPVCNPTGFEDNTHHSRGGPDLNTEFWRGSSEPEVRLLEEELRSHHFHGIVTLQSEHPTSGMYGYASGATLTRYLLEPALEAACEILPMETAGKIDGKAARNGVVQRDQFEGVLRAPANIRPRPFEISLQTPNQAPQYLQEHALTISLLKILEGYHEVVAYAANL